MKDLFPKDSSPWVRVGAVVAAIIFLAVFKTAITSALEAGVALGGIAILGLVGVGLTQSLPFLGQLLENRLLKLRKNEARKNPIEQMQNDFKYRQEQINVLHTSLVNIYAQIKSMGDMLVNRKKAAPNQDLTDQEKALAKINEFYQLNVEGLEAGKAALAEYKFLIEGEIFKWEFAEAGQQALSAMNATDQEGVLRDILSKEAVKSVQLKFNSVFAGIDMQVSSINSSKQLSFGAGMSLDVGSMQIPLSSKPKELA